MAIKFLWSACSTLALLVAMHGVAADEPMAKPALPQLSVNPAVVKLEPGQQQARLTYAFHNGSSTPFTIANRFAHFESDPPGWKSGVIGPIPMGTAVPGASAVMIQDIAVVPTEILQEALQAGALRNRKVVLAQSFAFKPNPVGLSSLTTRVTFVLDYPVSDISPTNFSTKHYDVTTLKQFADNPQKMAEMRIMLNYADKSYDALSKVLGFQPEGPKKIPLEINSIGGFPRYLPFPRPRISIPWDVVKAQGGIQFLYVVYPHELTHYFLLTQFPNPPKWFIEGPASFFGNEVALALGYRKSALHDRKKILGFAAHYEAKHCTYYFDPVWPEDKGRNDNPKDIHSLGFGYAYQICLELKQLCGPDLFPKVFRYMKTNHVDFSRAKDEHEKNVMLIQAFQSQTKKDLWAFFAKKGFKK